MGELIEGRGCELLFLRPYSPDLNPIERAFAKLKASLRRAQARTFGALIEAMGRALGEITSRDASGFFGHCGSTTLRSNCYDRRSRSGVTLTTIGSWAGICQVARTAYRICRGR